MLTIAHADRGRPTLNDDERFRNGYNVCVCRYRGNSISTITTYTNMTNHEYQGMFNIALLLKKLSKVAQ